MKHKGRLIMSITTKYFWGVVLMGSLFQPLQAQAVTIEMVNIPAGSFQMGSVDGDDDEIPPHKVHIRAFKLGAYEVTQKQWSEVMGTNPSKFKGDYNPVEQVGWNDVQSFIQRLNSQTGSHYRLPTEAEWEYAARAGTVTKWSWGDSTDDAGKFAWFGSNSGDHTHVVGSRSPNPWGLHDIHGNVWEWVQDCYVNAYYDAPEDGSARETGNCKMRVLRGGSWRRDSDSMRSAFRARNDSNYRYYSFGFRLVQD